MTLLLIVAALLLAAGLLIREVQARRERARNAEEHQRLAAALAETRAHMKRTQEDLYVLRCLLEEKRVLDDADVAQARARFVDAPRRTQAERDELARALNVSPTHLVLDGDADKLH